MGYGGKRASCGAWQTGCTCLLNARTLTVLFRLVLWCVIARSAVIRTALRCGLPGLVLRPGKWEYFNGPRECQCGKSLQGREQNLPLQGRFVRLARRMP